MHIVTHHPLDNINNENSMTFIHRTYIYTCLGNKITKNFTCESVELYGVTTVECALHHAPRARMYLGVAVKIIVPVYAPKIVISLLEYMYMHVVAN